MRKPDWQQNIAEERIIILFNLARKELDKHPERSKRYVQLARKICLRYNVRLPKDMKKIFCKNCNNLLIPGKTEKVRIDSKNKTISRTCLKCNRVYRYPYKE